MKSEKPRQTERLTIILIIVSIAVACTLLSLLCATILKRRNQLKNKLLETDFGKKFTKKKLFEDEENLVGKAFKKTKELRNERPPWYSYLASKIKKTVSSDQNENSSSDRSPKENYSVNILFKL